EHGKQRFARPVGGGPRGLAFGRAQLPSPPFAGNDPQSPLPFRGGGWGWGRSVTRKAICPTPLRLVSLRSTSLTAPPLKWRGGPGVSAPIAGGQLPPCGSRLLRRAEG